MEAGPSRRSTRRTTTTSLAPLIAESSCQQLSQPQAGNDDDSEDEFAAPQNGKRRRKETETETVKSVNTAAAKKQKLRKVQGLEQILGMPFDILFEIFGYLLPRDLLSLSRTSKDLRQCILHKDMKSTWTRSRSLVDGLPQCPEDMSEPLYAELAFGGGCLVCGEARTTVLIWAAHTRLCHSCVEKIYVVRRVISRLGVPARIVDKVPGTELRNNQRYSPIYGRKWAKEYKALKTREERTMWKEEKIAYSNAANSHGDACMKWRDSFEQMEELNQKKDRKARMVQMARTMGWDDTYDQVIENSGAIDKLCSRKMSDEAFDNADLKNLLNKILNSAKDRRTAEECKEQFKSRLQTLKDAYENAIRRWHSPLKPHPRISDIITVPRIQNIVFGTPLETTVSELQFGITEENLKMIIEEARGVIRQQLLDILKEGLKDKQYDLASVLDLATMTFITSYSKHKGLYMTTQQAINMMPDHDNFYGRPGIFTELYTYEVFRCNPWGRNANVCFDRPAHDATCNVLTFLGFDPSTTTVEEVEQVDPVIECVRCSTLMSGRLHMRWQRAASHLLASDTRDHLSSFVIADEVDTARARGEFRTYNEKWAYITGVQAMCKHCDFTAKVSLTRRHIWERHGVTFPTNDDMDIADSERNSYIVDTCWLWPPRP